MNLANGVLGQTKHLTERSKKDGEMVSPLVNGHGPVWRTSRSRMGLVG